MQIMLVIGKLNDLRLSALSGLYSLSFQIFAFRTDNEQEKEQEPHDALN